LKANVNWFTPPPLFVAENGHASGTPIDRHMLTVRFTSPRLREEVGV